MQPCASPPWVPTHPTPTSTPTFPLAPAPRPPGFFFGRTPLIQLSPKKTWEGFLGGCVGTGALRWLGGLQWSGQAVLQSGAQRAGCPGPRLLLPFKLGTQRRLPPLPGASSPARPL